MKYIYFLRHAKSDWSHIKKNIDIKDFDRSLSRTGIARAKKIKSFLKKNKNQIDFITCSSSKRTIETLEIIKPSIEKSIINLSDELYTFDFLKLIKIIHKFSDNFNKIMIIGHNPAMHLSVNYFLNKEINKKKVIALEKKFPTASLAILKFNERNWRKLKKDSGVISELVIPKKN